MELLVIKKAPKYSRLKKKKIEIYLSHTSKFRHVVRRPGLEDCFVPQGHLGKNRSSFCLIVLILRSSYKVHSMKRKVWEVVRSNFLSCKNITQKMHISPLLLLRQLSHWPHLEKLGNVGFNWDVMWPTNL